MGICLLLMAADTLAQVENFQRISFLPVTKDGTELVNAWAGGMNRPQFSPIDLNGDGILDLFVFDKSGNVISTFLNGGTPNQVDYSHAPEYQSQFPDLHDWALLVDYNGDNLPDIFTYGSAGIRVFKASFDSGAWSFELVENRLEYPGFSGNINISANSVDIPAFADVNNDGDIDVLNFDQPGSFVEYFENQTLETTGGLDTIWFERVSQCWGNFREAGGTSQVELGVFCIGGEAERSGVHAGSVILALDMDGDIDKELILGDVASPFLTMLTNGGTPLNANIVEQDATFPSYDELVEINEFLAPFSLDLDNDGLVDLAVAPTEKLSQSTDHIWWYKNTGTADNHVYTHQSNNFMVEQMVDIGVQSYPVFVDYNGDDLLDIIIGKLGEYMPDGTGGGSYTSSLTLLENVGTLEEPAFEWVTDDFGNLSTHNLFGMFPTFGDLDGDGDLDMLVGDEAGFIHYFENTAAAGEAMSLEANQLFAFQISGNAAATPFLVDITGDGLLDLVTGKKSGTLNYYENTGTASNFEFTLQSDFWGIVDVQQLGFFNGYSAPVITTLDDTGTPYLVVNSESGNVHLYTDLAADTFTHVFNALPNIQEGGQGGLSIADLNGDGFMEMLVGNIRGGVGLFSQGDFVVPAVEMVASNEGIHVYPNPAQVSVFIDFRNGIFFKKRTIQVFDIQGRAVAFTEQNTSPNRIILDLQDLATGIYFVQLTTEGRVWVEKLVVE